MRLLVPGANDITLLKPLSSAGYRPLLEAGIRVFEWNGTMLHAKTSVADGRWARVGSTNLNVASWFGNCELDAGDRGRALREADGGDVPAGPDERDRRGRPGREAAGTPVDQAARSTPGVRRRPGERWTRAAERSASATRSERPSPTAACWSQRVEARLPLSLGALLLAVSLLFAFFPRLLAYPLAVLLGWIALSLLYRGYELRREGKRPRPPGDASRRRPPAPP